MSDDFVYQELDMSDNTMECPSCEHIIVIGTGACPNCGYGED